MEIRTLLKYQKINRPKINEENTHLDEDIDKVLKEWKNGSTNRRLHQSPKGNKDKNRESIRSLFLGYFEQYLT